MVRRTFIFLALLALLALVGPAPSRADERPQSSLPVQMLEIASKTGVHHFAVEFAATPEQTSRGLMFRKELPDGRGMLFDFKRDGEVSMWMKNTLIPLDMLFIRSDGRIHRIAENTVPHSLTPIPSGGPVRAVLEIAGGTSRKLGIAVGDRVAHPLFRGGR